MITVNNFKCVLTDLGFTEDNGIFRKECNGSADSVVIADFTHQKLVYPPRLKVHRKTTTNFSQDENFVVFECITVLLDKGYKPEHIELERPMPGGHHDTGGYCDILVKDNEGKTFLLIECKRSDE